MTAISLADSPPVLDRATFAFARLHDVDERGLCTPELDCLSDKATPKRQCEFVAGRVAAHRALKKLTGAVHAVVRVDDGPHRGFPRVLGDAALFVSISHHDGLAFAAASHAPIGVDLARHETYSRAFLDTAFFDGELDAWPTASIAFAAKEAASKLLRVGFALPLLGFRCVPGRVDVFERVDGVERGAHRVAFRVRRIRERIVVVARFA